MPLLVLSIVSLFRFLLLDLHSAGVPLFPFLLLVLGTLYWFPLEWHSGYLFKIPVRLWSFLLQVGFDFSSAF